MYNVPEIKFARQNSHGFRVNQRGRLTYVYGAFRPDGSVLVSVFIGGEMVFSDVITGGQRRGKTKPFHPVDPQEVDAVPSTPGGVTAPQAEGAPVPMKTETPTSGAVGNEG